VSLFDSTPPEEPHAAEAADTRRPLAERMRPRTLEEYIGQEHILGPGKPLRKQIERDELSSIILWGPPAASSSRSARCSAASRRSSR
jgi:putative ATPase